MMKYLQVYALLLLSVCCSSCGQNQTNLPQENIKAKSTNYSESQLKEADTAKVPVSMVRNVKQARNGDILIASYLGVFRYDGTSFTNLTSKIIAPRFSSFWDVLEDQKGNLWFASKDSGVYCYNGKSFQHFTTKDGLARNLALHIYEDRTGSAQGEKMFVYDGKTFTVLKDKNGRVFNNVWSIIEDKKGNIWFGDVGGLWRYDGSTFTHVSKRGAYAIVEDKKGNIWTTGEVNPNVWALSRYDAKSLYDITPTVTEIRSGGRMDFLGILEAKDGSIWYGSGKGVHRYDGNTFTDFKI